MTFLIFLFWFWVSALITVKVWGMGPLENGDVDGKAAVLTFFQAIALMWLFYAIRDRDISGDSEQQATPDGDTEPDA